jgi:hypothetical protein
MQRSSIFRHRTGQNGEIATVLVCCLVASLPQGAKVVHKTEYTNKNSFDVK